MALLTPVAKAFLTDLGLETTVHGQQVFGGHGYIREWGQEQLVRDVRITQIYEGTNGIQALDLVGRKIVGSGGALYKLFADEIRHFTANRQRGPGRVHQAAERRRGHPRRTDRVAAGPGQEQPERNRRGLGRVPAGVRLHRLRLHVGADGQGRPDRQGSEDDFYASKLGTARFYFARLLPRIHSLSASVKAGSESLFLLEETQF